MQCTRPGAETLPKLVPRAGIVTFQCSTRMERGLVLPAGAGSDSRSHPHSLGSGVAAPEKHSRGGCLAITGRYYVNRLLQCSVVRGRFNGMGWAHRIASRPGLDHGVDTRARARERRRRKAGRPGSRPRHPKETPWINGKDGRASSSSSSAAAAAG